MTRPTVQLYFRCPISFHRSNSRSEIPFSGCRNHCLIKEDSLYFLFNVRL